MRLTSLLTALTGLAVAGGSVYLARDFLQNSAPVAEASEATTVPVVVAGADIAFGQPLEAHMLTTIDWPRNAVPTGAFQGFDNLLPADGQESRRAKRAFSKGDVVLSSKVSKFGEKVTITQTLDASRRAIAITVNAQTSVGGFVTPGDSVDIVLTRGSGEDLRAVTILQNVRVIGVDQTADENNDAPSIARTVTVDVSPEEAQRLSLAQSAGRLSLTLRSVEATNDEPLESIRLRDIMQEKSPVPQDAPRPTILVRRGVTVTEDAVR
jgi:pilus assembly protein CpaB